MAGGSEGIEEDRIESKGLTLTEKFSAAALILVILVCISHYLFGWPR